MCRAGEFNMSYESLTGRAARQTLQDLQDTDAEFLAELRRPQSCVLPPILSHDEALLEDSEELELDIPGDDSAVPLEVVEDDVHGNFSTEPDQAFVMGQDGLIPATEAEETLVEEVGGEVLDTTAAMEQEGRGQRKKIKNRLYLQENLRWWDTSR